MPDTPHSTTLLSAFLRSATRRIARWTSADDAEDIAQEAIARTLHAGVNPRSSGFRGYVDQASRSVTVDRLRRATARGGIAVALDELPEALTPRTSSDQEATVLLRQLILALPQTYRDTFILNRIVGLTYAEIAVRHGVTVKAVEYRMSRALALCIEALRED